MGHGWDHSYNLFIEFDGFELIYHGGTGRQDRFIQRYGTDYIASGFFQTLAHVGNDAYTMTFSDGATYNFNPFDGSPEQGKIASSVDRNGNTMVFSYDGAGRLSIITDTLGRDLLVVPDAADRVASITDFAGRQIVYTYYADGDAGGSEGDLASVTTPSVTGTPRGNDYPAGRTTTYTYSKGASHPELDHNLTSITDPKGQRYIVNEYASTIDPEDISFDRVLRQTWGTQARSSTSSTSRRVLKNDVQRSGSKPLSTTASETSRSTRSITTSASSGCASTRAAGPPISPPPRPISLSPPHSEAPPRRSRLLRDPSRMDSRLQGRAHHPPERQHHGVSH